MFADLHLHTRFSDGTYEPAELAAKAHQLGFTCVAVTDHDTVEGCAPMARACEALGISFISGVELTAEFKGQEIHVLGYGFDPADPNLLNQIAQFQAIRQQRIRDMVARLNELNIPLAVERVFALANCRAPGRPHVARALVEAGVCRDVDEAFERFLKKHRPAWVPKRRITAEEAVALIHRAGGAAVLAHPGLYSVDPWLSDLVRAGLDGLECFHTKHSHMTTEYYLSLASRLGLVVTGGSDCHGENKGQPLLGSVRVGPELVGRLRDRIAYRQANRLRLTD
ncbi:MAG: PHP domain-containing protein [Verrucomicrobiota bacterium]|nr:PHP domain-containing protein [Limisphaera sp.]MDW8381800.1 PHP domain-containing protein [Verrucomicrobiota bacterium]